MAFVLENAKRRRLVVIGAAIAAQTLVWVGRTGRRPSCSRTPSGAAWSLPSLSSSLLPPLSPVTMDGVAAVVAVNPPEKKLDESGHGDLGSSWDRREVAWGSSGQIRALLDSWDLLGTILGSP